jgi:hypothetical protein
MTLALVVTGIGLVLAVLSWLPRSGSPLQGALSATALASVVVLGLARLFGDDALSGWGDDRHAALLLLSGALAIAGGGPLTTTVLALVDRGNPAKQSTQEAGQVLRGGALIGSLERGGIFAAVLAGWPEGLAVVLAIKGLARYPELKGPDEGGLPVTPHAVAERFIIGTFVSVLWAIGCAGLLA